MNSNPYVDEYGNDTAYYIFHELYLCRVTLSQLRSIEEIREFGMPSMWDPAEDRMIANELQVIQISIAKMLELHDSGAVIYVCKPEDTKRIYDRISNHLIAWKEYIRTKMNSGNAPIEDLLRLDEFANVVYEKAKYHLDQEFVESTFGRAFSELHMSAASLVSGIAAGSYVQTPDSDAVGDDPSLIEQNFPRRVSMQDDFTNRLRSRMLNRKKPVTSPVETVPSSIGVKPNSPNRNFISDLLSSMSKDD